MREIKFRIFEYNKMHYPKQYKENKFDNYFIDLNGELRYYQNCYDGGFFDTENAKLMQYTGLHDKNGKEIYEGDIINYHDRIKNKEDVFVVKYCGERAAFVLSNETYPEMTINVKNQIIVAKVIGNIYENPELLERSSNGD